MSLKSERIYNTMMLTGAGAPVEVKAKDLPNLLEKPDSSIKKKKKSPAPKKVLKYSDNFKLDYLTGGWVVVDRDKMIGELEAELKEEREKVLMCVHEDVNDLAKEVSLGMYSNNGIVEELVKLSQRIDTMRSEP